MAAERLWWAAAVAGAPALWAAVCAATLNLRAWTGRSLLDPCGHCPDIRAPDAHTTRQWPDSTSCNFGLSFFLTLHMRRPFPVLHFCPLGAVLCGLTFSAPAQLRVFSRLRVYGWLKKRKLAISPASLPWLVEGSTGDQSMQPPGSSAVSTSLPQSLPNPHLNLLAWPRASITVLHSGCKQVAQAAAGRKLS